MKKVCVYCGSSPGKRPEYFEAASELAKELVKRGIGLVYGGASIGVMGQIADAVLAAGGEVVGVIPKVLLKKEVVHQGLTELIVVESMHERKSVMADISDAFIALPGGFGTLEELFEILTWSQLGLHQKPCALLNVANYYDHLSSFLHHAVEQQFLKSVHHDMLLIEQEPERLLERIASYQAPAVAKWIERNDT